MALTRAYLKGMGLTEEQVSAIVEAHSETVTALKETNAALQKDLDAAKEATKNADLSGEWKTKYDALSAEYDGFKKSQADKEARSAKESAFEKLLREAGVGEKRIASIMKVSDIDGLAITKEGTLKDADKLSESIKTEWSDFIAVPVTKGAAVANPPKNTGSAMTKDQIMAISDRAERRAAIKANPGLFVNKGE